MLETVNAVDRGGMKFFSPGGPAFVVFPALRVRYTPEGEKGADAQ